MDNPKKIYAAACQMLYDMEVDLGLAKMPYHQKRVIQVAAGVASERGQFETAEVLDLCGTRYGMSRATFFRALAALKRSGWASEVRPGTYTLRLSGHLARRTRHGP